MAPVLVFLFIRWDCSGIRSFLRTSAVPIMATVQFDKQSGHCQQADHWSPTENVAHDNPCHSMQAHRPRRQRRHLLSRRRPPACSRRRNRHPRPSSRSARVPPKRRKVTRAHRGQVGAGERGLQPRVGGWADPPQRLPKEGCKRMERRSRRQGRHLDGPLVCLSGSPRHHAQRLSTQPRCDRVSPRQCHRDDPTGDSGPSAFDGPEVGALGGACARQAPIHGNCRPLWGAPLCRSHYRDNVVVDVGAAPHLGGARGQELPASAVDRRAAGAARARSVRPRRGAQPEARRHAHGGGGEVTVAAALSWDGGEPQRGAAALRSRNPRPLPARQVG